MLSHAQIDKLGDRLKAGPTTEADLRLLDEYRLRFAEAYVSVVAVLVRLELQPTGREAKSRGAIVDKLRRESVRLSQIQDIAGCRVVVADRRVQDFVGSRLISAVTDADLIDRRAAPSHGYRALHVVVRLRGRPVEVQIRTAWQHHWAETSEKLSDEIGPGIKYGHGPRDLQEQMARWSDAIHVWENWLASRTSAGQATLTEQTRAEREHQVLLAERHRALELLADLRAARQAKGDAASDFPD